MFHVPNNWRVTKGAGATDEDAGNNGMFVMPVGETAMCNIVASDGAGWEHVSVSVAFARRCPTWEEMALVASIFWDAEDVLVQYRPAKKDYVNCHPFTLHWWRPIGVVLPTPNPIMVGPRSEGI
jgi:hypothetical protein